MASKKSNRVGSALAGMLNTVSYILLIVGISLIISTFCIVVANDVLALVKDGGEVTLELTEDSTPSEVGKLLKEKSAISYPWAFRLFSKLKHVESYEAGSYTLDRSMDYNQMITALKNSESVAAVVRVTIPEGYTMKEICALLVEKNVVREEAFWKVANNYEFAHFMLKDVPMVENRLEGYLFPDTYEFYLDSDAQSVVNKFIENYKSKITDEMKTRAQALGYTMDQIITLASIIQKECDADIEECANVSSVFHNRLKDPASFPKLQSDVTTFYITENLKDMLGYEDGIALENQNDEVQKYMNLYSTYYCSGLPVGAICNPGMKAINAALHPADTDYVFFLTDKSGENFYYAATIDKHNENGKAAGLF